MRRPARPAALARHINPAPSKVYRYRYTASITPVLDVRFYRTAAGAEPVRDWLRGLSADDKKTIGTDIKTVQIGWPLGMPLVRKMEAGLWEVRIGLDNRVARVLFTVVGSDMVLLHGFIKKSQKTPPTDLNAARDRMKEVRNG